MDAREQLANVRDILSDRRENKIMLEKLKVCLERIMCMLEKNQHMLERCSLNGER